MKKAKKYLLKVIICLVVVSLWIINAYGQKGSTIPQKKQTKPTARQASQAPDKIGNNQPATQTFIVLAKQKWFDTGIDLNQGQKFSLSAQGSWTNGGANPQWVGPSGWANVLLPKTVAPNQPLSSLVGKIGDTPVFIGENYSGLCPQNGRLYLSINDTENDFDDNDGSVNATVKVQNINIVLNPDIITFFPYTLELNGISPNVTYDPTKETWTQPYQMTGDKITLKYTLFNKANTKIGKIKADINGQPLLTTALNSNRIGEILAGSNFSSEFMTTALPSGNYKLRIIYIVEAMRINTKNLLREPYDSIAARREYEYIVPYFFIPAEKCQNLIQLAFLDGRVQLSQTNAGSPINIVLPQGGTKKSMSYISFGALFNKYGVSNVDIDLPNFEYSVESLKNTGGASLLGQYIVTGGTVFVDKFHFFINDIYSDLTSDRTVRFHNNEILLDFKLHSPNPAIRGEGNGYTGALIVPIPIGWQDGLCPDISLNNMSVTIHITPFVDGNHKLHLQDPRVDVNGDLSLSVGDWLAKDIKKKVLTIFQSKLQSELRKDKIKNALEAGVTEMFLTWNNAINENIKDIIIDESGIKISFGK